MTVHLIDLRSNAFIFYYVLLHLIVFVNFYLYAELSFFVCGIEVTQKGKLMFYAVIMNNKVLLYLCLYKALLCVCVHTYPHMHACMITQLLWFLQLKQGVESLFSMHS